MKILDVDIYNYIIVSV